MSRYPETRDSDIALTFRYWAEYHPDLYSDFQSDRSAMYSLPRQTSLARARARIQNTHRLFLASDDVRRRRRMMSEEERERFMNPPPSDPLLMVYADESGKTQPQLVVGSIWLLDPGDAVVIYNRTEEWRRSQGFGEEFHFNRMTRYNLPRYQEVVDVVLAAVAGISFKAVSVSREGIADVGAAVDDLYVALLSRGVQHESDSGRAPLPRRIEIWKDRESEGPDALLATRIHSALTAESLSRFDGRLRVESIEAIDSKGQPLIQLADLYTSSVSRVLNRSEARNHKDEFADWILERLRPRGELAKVERLGDMEVHIRL